MPQRQIGLKCLPSIGIVAAFGFITMSSSMVGFSPITTNIQPYYCCDVHKFSLADNTICNSSMLSKQAIGDFVSTEKKPDFVQQHEKIQVNLRVTKISKHVSNFDFEEEFEEI